MTESRLVDHACPNRRSLLKSAALGSVAALAAPYVRSSFAAGSLALGVWDHWVPGANNALIKLCNEWGAKNNCEVKIDFITSQGEKDKLTAAAEAQAGTGHDIMSHRDWNVRIHQNVLEPLDDVVEGLLKQYGAISPVSEYLAKIKGTWRAARGSTSTSSMRASICATFSRPMKRNTARRKSPTGIGIPISTRRRSFTKPVSRSVCRWDSRATRSTGLVRCSIPTAW